jgi:quercetin dioxygenase-like cupin family protein
MSPARETPRVLTDLGRHLDHHAGQGTPRPGGALWRLAEPGRQLDANLVRLAPGAEVGEHTEGDLDVLLIVVEGGGQLGRGAEPREELRARTVAWLPRGSRRSLHAGPEGLVYLTAHRRRPGLTITGPGPAASALSAEGGDAPCLLDRVCPACDRVSPDPTARFCGRCGAALPTRRS